LVQVGRYQQALSMLASASNESSDTWAWRSIAHSGLDQNDEAVDAAQKGLAINPEDPDLYLCLARAHEDTDDLAAGERAVLEGIRRAPRIPQFWACYARLCGLAGQPDKATALIAEAAQLDPESVDTAEARVLLAWLRNDDAEVARCSHQLLALDPNSQSGHAFLGLTSALSGRPDEAAENMRTAVLLDPSRTNIVALADETRILAHWAMWPIRPLHWLGGAQSWIFAFAVAFLLMGMGFESLGMGILMLYVVLAVYSWVVPPIVRRQIRRL